ncbi:MAG: DNA-binding protein [Candidatus Asgardarchaeia archaeon]
MSEDEIAALRKKKMLEMQRQLMEAQLRAQQEEQARAEYERQKEAILRSILTSEARGRLANLKMVKPEFVEQVELQLIQLAQAGRLPTPLTDDQLKAILRKLASSKREPRIIFK